MVGGFLGTKGLNAICEDSFEGLTNGVDLFFFLIIIVLAFFHGVVAMGRAGVEDLSDECKRTTLACCSGFHLDLLRSFSSVELPTAFPPR